MTMSMYQASIPVFLRALSNLAHVLRVGEQHAQEQGLAATTLLETRLIPDMLPLTRQVQIATDISKNGTARLAAVEPPKIADDETSFAELQARITRVQDYLKGFEPAQLDGSETRKVTLQTRDGEQHFEGDTYLLHQVIPNLFFHCATAYAILRQAGAPLGKRDYLGAA